MANIVDRLVGWFDPDAGLKRFWKRERLVRAYEGASRKDGWKPRRAGASANADHRADAAELRVRARALVQNVPYVARGFSHLVASVIGTGITPKSLAPGATGETLNKLWAQWVDQADADGRLNVYGLQAAAQRAMEIDGEVLIRLRTRRAEDALAVPLQLQLLEIDHLDSAKSGRNGANVITNGIEFDVLGRVVAYWLFDQHPGDTASILSRRSASRPIPAAQIIHYYSPDRPGQARGMPRLASVITRVRDLSLYEDAEQARKNLETRLSVIASGDATLLTNAEAESAADPGKAGVAGDLGALPSGGILQVPTGTNLTVIEPKVVQGYVEYLKLNLHLIAAGMGVPYEAMTGDVREVNFSSARIRQIDYRRECEQMQWLTTIPRLCTPIWRAFVDAAELINRIQRVDYAVDHATPKWDYVNPKDDVDAELDAISGGLMSISEALRRRGYDPKQVFDELEQDINELRNRDLLDVLLFMRKGKSQEAAVTDSKTKSKSSQVS